MMSRKSLLIMRNECWRRVTSRTFILTTLLGPALLVGLLALVIIGVSSSIGDEFGGKNESLRIAIIDKTGVLGDQMIRENDGNHVLFHFDGDHDSAVEDAVSSRMDAFILIPETIISGTGQPVLYSFQDRGFRVQLELAGIIERSLKDHLLLEANVTDDIRAILDRSVGLDFALTGYEDAQSTANSSLDVDATTDDVGIVMMGTILALMMYMTILIYGTLIMYGVIEERSTRVVEIIVSSVRPIDLMMGKVLGIGLVGLIQMLTWLLIIIGGLVFASPIVGLFVDPAMVDASSQEVLSSIDLILSELSIQLVMAIVVYFIGGYLMYGGLLAAVGSMVDSPQDAQTLLIPVIIPIMAPMMFLSVILLSPNGAISMGLSLFPLTSPVTMAVRLAIGSVPVWQLLISLASLIVSVFGAIWVSAQIYRSSILMYGKKPSLKTVFTYLKTG